LTYLSPPQKHNYTLLNIFYHTFSANVSAYFNKIIAILLVILSKRLKFLTKCDRIIAMWRR